MTSNFQTNTVYSDLLSKVHYPNIQYLFGNYLSSVPINKKCISFYLFCLFLSLPGSYLEAKVTGKRVNRRGGYGLEVPVNIA